MKSNIEKIEKRQVTLVLDEGDIKGMRQLLYFARTNPNLDKHITKETRDLIKSLQNVGYPSPSGNYTIAIFL